MFTVWVGGVQVHDYVLSKTEAERIAHIYKTDGYDDVAIQEMSAEEKV